MDRGVPEARRGAKREEVRPYSSPLLCLKEKAQICYNMKAEIRLFLIINMLHVAVKLHHGIEGL